MPKADPRLIVRVYLAASGAWRVSYAGTILFIGSRPAAVAHAKAFAKQVVGATVEAGSGRLPQ